MRKLIILILLLSSLQLRATKVEVHATVYNAVVEQCNEDPGFTAFMFKLNLKDPYSHRIIAVSRDLLEDFPNGTLVLVTGTDYDGIYIVKDKMNKRFTKRIDILINGDMPIGSWKNVTIQNVTEI